MLQSKKSARAHKKVICSGLQYEEDLYRLFIVRMFLCKKVFKDMPSVSEYRVEKGTVQTPLFNLLPSA